MNSVIVFAFLFLSVTTPGTCSRKSDSKHVPVLERDEQRNEKGFSHRYVTGDGIKLSETGKFKEAPDGTDSILVKEGSYSYTSPEGKSFHLAYVADENGFRPIAGHEPPPEEQ
ncbi:hypothetical protein J437_LFUL016863 [Ladona fulva]|uniref:Uncharacterized protein n=1 Tax=Ladona fulva TaxID=123851 RepID=A0A8K0KMK3_LADFU|nr:hypothetical protein J437_LFUL016863 [Ladona fulva]